MRKNTRRGERFSEIGRFEAGDLCAFPGVVEDVSEGGCRVHFPVDINLDMEKDYHALLHLPENKEKTSLKLLCHPQWVSIEKNKPVVGFSFLSSTDTPALMSHIDSLKKEKESSPEIEKMLFNSTASFV